ncbi:GNAT family N-acetyltransferase [Zhouia sp. PK063]|uniref:GNAT family N-acetyltransferase n=1 Tax=Zhouia sp. PK063 TaxID=3373602 RepID=UPI0037A80397
MIHIIQEEQGKRGKFIILENEKPAGEITYVWAGIHKFIIDHTVTFEGFTGKGYAKQLVMATIEFAKKKNVKIIPLCPYAKKVMEKDITLHSIIFS